MQLIQRAVLRDHGDLLGLLLEPLDRAAVAVDAHAQAVVVADGHLAGPVHAGRAALIFHHDEIVVVQLAARHDDVHLGKHALDLQARHRRHGIFDVGAQIAQAVGIAGKLRVAAPFSLLAAPLALIGQPALGILRRHRAHLADIAALDDLLRVLGGDVAHVGVGHQEQQVLFLRQLLELGGLLGVDAQRLVARHVDARLQEGLAGAVVRVVRRDHHDEIDLVLAGALGLRHFLIVRVQAVFGDVQLLARGDRLFVAARKTTRHQRGLAVQVNRMAMGVTDVSPGSAAHHAVGKPPAHNTLPFQSCPDPRSF